MQSLHRTQLFTFNRSACVDETGRGLPLPAPYSLPSPPPTAAASPAYTRPTKSDRRRKQRRAVPQLHLSLLPPLPLLLRTQGQKLNHQFVSGTSCPRGRYGHLTVGAFPLEGKVCGHEVSFKNLAMMENLILQANCQSSYWSGPWWLCPGSGCMVSPWRPATKTDTNAISNTITIHSKRWWWRSTRRLAGQGGTSQGTEGSQEDREQGGGPDGKDGEVDAEGGHEGGA